MHASPWSPGRLEAMEQPVLQACPTLGLQVMHAGQCLHAGSLLTQDIGENDLDYTGCCALCGGVCNGQDRGQMPAVQLSLRQEAAARVYPSSTTACKLHTLLEQVE